MGETKGMWLTDSALAIDDIAIKDVMLGQGGLFHKSHNAVKRGVKEPPFYSACAILTQRYESMYKYFMAKTLSYLLCDKVKT